MIIQPSQILSTGKQFVIPGNSLCMRGLFLSHCDQWWSSWRFCRFRFSHHSYNRDGDFIASEYDLIESIWWIKSPNWDRDVPHLHFLSFLCLCLLLLSPILIHHPSSSSFCSLHYLNKDPHPIQLYINKVPRRKELYFAGNFTRKLLKVVGIDQKGRQLILGWGLTQHLHQGLVLVI